MTDAELERRCQAVLDAPPIIDDGTFPHEWFGAARQVMGLPAFYDGIDVHGDDYSGPPGRVGFELPNGVIHSPWSLTGNERLQFKQAWHDYNETESK